MAKKKFNMAEGADNKQVPGSNYVQTNNQGSADIGTTDVKAPSTSSDTQVKEVDIPKSVINTTKAADAVAAGTGSNMGSATYSTRGGGVVFSGGAGAIGNDMSATTRATDSYRSGDRAGRKSDSITRKVDLLTAEIITEKIEQSKPLDETDAKQGYNGQYLNDHARAQKLNGGSPADPQFMRSLDEIDVDMIYYADGQYVVEKDLSDASERDYKVPDWKASLNNGNGDYAKVDGKVQLGIGAAYGSYVPKQLTIVINKDGTLDNFNFQCDDITAQYKDEATYRAANDSFLRTRNRIELDRTAMLEAAGNESDPGWSPLPLAIPQATEQNRLLRDLDLSIGDIVYTSRRKLSTALAYQCNKTAKDGSKVQTPIAEMCNGLVATNTLDVGAINSFGGDSRRVTFNSFEALTNGSAALYVAMNDSTTKYNTKGKFLTLPLSFKAALANAESSCAPLKMHAQLEQLMAKNELFSTIDGPYEGVKPVVVTDKSGIAVPFDLSESSSNGQFPVYTMHYENLRNKYNNTISNYLLSGLYRYINQRSGNIAAALLRAYKEEHPGVKDESIPNSFTIVIPAVSSTTTVSLWDTLVCAACPLIVEDRIQAMYPLLAYEDKHGYPYSGAVALGQVDTCRAENFSFTSADDVLVTAIAKPVAAMKVIMPEVFWPIAKANAKSATSDADGIVAKTVLPHYFVQNQFTQHTVAGNKLALLLNDDYASMAYPSTRSGSKFSFMDTVYGMSEEDYRLSLDRMVVYPCYGADLHGIAKTKSGNNAYGYGTYKYGLTADGQPIIPYFAFATNEDHKAETFTVGDLLKTPRELGLCCVAPAGYLSLVPKKSNAAVGHRLSLDASYLGMSGPGFRAKLYHAGENNNNLPTGTILGTGTTNMEWNASLRGSFESVYAMPSSANYNKGWTFNAATTLADTTSPVVTGSYSHNGSFDYDADNGTYKNDEAQENLVSMHGMAKYFWNRLQRMPFAVNPFDVNTSDLDKATDTMTGINQYDIFDFLYALNLCGFRASDYSELIFGRSKQRIAKGMNYVDDPFVEKSMLLN